jgi:hypothetical protein
VLGLTQYGPRIPKLAVSHLMTKQQSDSLESGAFQFWFYFHSPKSHLLLSESLVVFQKVRRLVITVIVISLHASSINHLDNELLCTKYLTIPFKEPTVQVQRMFFPPKPLNLTDMA